MRKLLTKDPARALPVLLLVAMLLGASLQANVEAKGEATSLFFSYERAFNDLKQKAPQQQNPCKLGHRMARQFAKSTAMFISLNHQHKFEGFQMALDWIKAKKDSSIDLGCFEKRFTSLYEEYYKKYTHCDGNCPRAGGVNGVDAHGSAWHHGHHAHGFGQHGVHIGGHSSEHHHGFHIGGHSSEHHHGLSNSLISIHHGESVFGHSSHHEHHHSEGIHIDHHGIHVDTHQVLGGNCGARIGHSLVVSARTLSHYSKKTLMKELLVIKRKMSSIKSVTRRLMFRVKLISIEKSINIKKIVRIRKMIWKAKREHRCVSDLQVRLTRCLTKEVSLNKKLIRIEKKIVIRQQKMIKKIQLKIKSASHFERKILKEKLHRLKKVTKIFKQAIVHTKRIVKKTLKIVHKVAKKAGISIPHHHHHGHKHHHHHGHKYHKKSVKKQFKKSIRVFKHTKRVVTLRIKKLQQKLLLVKSKSKRRQIQVKISIQRKKIISAKINKIRWMIITLKKQGKSTKHLEHRLVKLEKKKILITRKILKIQKKIVAHQQHKVKHLRWSLKIAKGPERKKILRKLRKFKKLLKKSKKFLRKSLKIIHREKKVLKIIKKGGFKKFLKVIKKTGGRSHHYKSHHGKHVHKQVKVIKIRSVHVLALKSKKTLKKNLLKLRLKLKTVKSRSERRRIRLLILIQKKALNLKRINKLKLKILKYKRMGKSTKHLEKKLSLVIKRQAKFSKKTVRIEKRLLKFKIHRLKILRHKLKHAKGHERKRLLKQIKLIKKNIKIFKKNIKISRRSAKRYFKLSIAVKKGKFQKFVRSEKKIMKKVTVSYRHEHHKHIIKQKKFSSRVMMFKSKKFLKKSILKLQQKLKAATSKKQRKLILLKIMIRRKALNLKLMNKLKLKILKYKRMGKSTKHLEKKLSLVIKRQAKFSKKTVRIQTKILRLKILRLRKLKHLLKHAKGHARRKLLRKIRKLRKAIKITKIRILKSKKATKRYFKLSIAVKKGNFKKFVKSEKRLMKKISIFHRKTGFKGYHHHRARGYRGVVIRRHHYTRKSTTSLKKNIHKLREKLLTVKSKTQRRKIEVKIYSQKVAIAQKKIGRIQRTIMIFRKHHRCTLGLERQLESRVSHAKEYTSKILINQRKIVIHEKKEIRKLQEKLALVTDVHERHKLLKLIHHSESHLLAEKAKLKICKSKEHVFRKAITVIKSGGVVRNLKKLIHKEVLVHHIHHEKAVHHHEQHFHHEHHVHGKTCGCAHHRDEHIGHIHIEKKKYVSEKVLSQQSTSELKEKIESLKFKKSKITSVSKRVQIDIRIVHQEEAINLKSIRVLEQTLHEKSKTSECTRLGGLQKKLARLYRRQAEYKRSLVRLEKTLIKRENKAILRLREKYTHAKTLQEKTILKTQLLNKEYTVHYAHKQLTQCKKAARRQAQKARKLKKAYKKEHAKDFNIKFQSRRSKKSLKKDIRKLEEKMAILKTHNQKRRVEVKLLVFKKAILLQDIKRVRSQIRENKTKHISNRKYIKKLSKLRRKEVTYNVKIITIEKKIVRHEQKKVIEIKRKIASCKDLHERRKWSRKLYKHKNRLTQSRKFTSKVVHSQKVTQRRLLKVEARLSRPASAHKIAKQSTRALRKKISHLQAELDGAKSSSQKHKVEVKIFVYRKALTIKKIQLEKKRLAHAKEQHKDTLAIQARLARLYKKEVKFNHKIISVEKKIYLHEKRQVTKLRKQLSAVKKPEDKIRISMKLRKIETRARSAKLQIIRSKKAIRLEKKRQQKLKKTIAKSQSTHVLVNKPRGLIKLRIVKLQAKLAKAKSSTQKRKVQITIINHQRALNLQEIKKAKKKLAKSRQASKRPNKKLEIKLITLYRKEKRYNRRIIKIEHKITKHELKVIAKLKLQLSKAKSPSEKKKIQRKMSKCQKRINTANRVITIAKINSSKTNRKIQHEKKRLPKAPGAKTLSHLPKTALKHQIRFLKQKLTTAHSKTEKRHIEIKILTSKKAINLKKLHQLRREARKAEEHHKDTTALKKQIVLCYRKEARYSKKITIIETKIVKHKEHKILKLKAKLSNAPPSEKARIQRAIRKNERKLLKEKKQLAKAQKAVQKNTKKALSIKFVSKTGGSKSVYRKQTGYKLSKHGAVSHKHSIVSHHHSTSHKSSTAKKNKRAAFRLHIDRSLSNHKTHIPLVNIPGCSLKSTLFEQFTQIDKAILDLEDEEDKLKDLIRKSKTEVVSLIVKDKDRAIVLNDKVLRPSQEKLTTILLDKASLEEAKYTRYIKTLTARIQLFKKKLRGGKQAGKWQSKIAHSEEDIATTKSLLHKTHKTKAKLREIARRFENLRAEEELEKEKLKAAEKDKRKHRAEKRREIEAALEKQKGCGKLNKVDPAIKHLKQKKQERQAKKAELHKQVKAAAKSHVAHKSVVKRALGYKPVHIKKISKPGKPHQVKLAKSLSSEPASQLKSEIKHLLSKQEKTKSVSRKKQLQVDILAHKEAIQLKLLHKLVEQRGHAKGAKRHAIDHKLHQIEKKRDSLIRKEIIVEKSIIKHANDKIHSLLHLYPRASKNDQSRLKKSVKKYNHVKKDSKRHIHELRQERIHIAEAQVKRHEKSILRSVKLHDKKAAQRQEAHLKKAESKLKTLLRAEVITHSKRSAKYAKLAHKEEKKVKALKSKLSHEKDAGKRHVIETKIGLLKKSLSHHSKSASKEKSRSKKASSKYRHYNKKLQAENHKIETAIAHTKVIVPVHVKKPEKTHHIGSPKKLSHRKKSELKKEISDLKSKLSHTKSEVRKSQIKADIVVHKTAIIERGIHHLRKQAHKAHGKDKQKLYSKIHAQEKKKHQLIKKELALEKQVIKGSHAKISKLEKLLHKAHGNDKQKVKQAIQHYRKEAKLSKGRISQIRHDQKSESVKEIHRMEKRIKKEAKRGKTGKVKKFTARLHKAQSNLKKYYKSAIKRHSKAASKAKQRAKHEKAVAKKLHQRAEATKDHHKQHKLERSAKHHDKKAKKLFKKASRESKKAKHAKAALKKVSQKIKAENKRAKKLLKKAKKAKKAKSHAKHHHHHSKKHHHAKKEHHHHHAKKHHHDAKKHHGKHHHAKKHHGKHHHHHEKKHHHAKRHSHEHKTHHHAKKHEGHHKKHHKDSKKHPKKHHSKRGAHHQKHSKKHGKGKHSEAKGRKHRRARGKHGKTHSKRGAHHSKATHKGHKHLLLI